MNDKALIETIRNGLEGGGEPKFMRLAGTIAEKICSGNLPEGRRMPSYRNLSKALGVSEGTVQRAYRELERQALIAPRVGDGSYVLGPSPREREKFGNAPVDKDLDRRNTSFIDLSRNQFLLKKDLGDWAEFYDLSGTVRAHLFNLLNYTDERGMPAHRVAGAKWLLNHRLEVPPDDIFCTNGSQHGIHLAMSALMRTHDAIAVDEYTYPGLLALAGRMGVRTVGIEHDGKGMRPECLADKIGRNRISAVFTTPTVQNPLNYQMPDDRRDEIAEVCRKGNVFIIEDETQGVLLGQPYRSFYDRLPDQTVLISGMSKAMSSGLRVGYLAVPNRFRERFVQAMKDDCWMATPLSHEIAMRCIDSGFADESIRRIRKEIGRRRKLIDPILSGVDYASADHSPHYWIALRNGVDDIGAEESLMRRNIKVSPSHQFHCGPRQIRHYIRASITAYDTASSIAGAFREMLEFTKADLSDIAS